MALLLAKARRGEPICAAAIGGSITAGGANTKDPALHSTIRSNSSR